MEVVRPTQLYRSPILSPVPSAPQSSFASICYQKSVIPLDPTQTGIKEWLTDPLIFISIPLLIGSWAPYILIRPSIFSACCVSSQFFNLASSGCRPFTSADTECRPSRIGSGIERTLGAPLEVETCVAWLEAGAIRRDYGIVSAHVTPTHMARWMKNTILLMFGDAKWRGEVEVEGRWITMVTHHRQGPVNQIRTNSSLSLRSIPAILKYSSRRYLHGKMSSSLHDAPHLLYRMENVRNWLPSQLA